MTNEMNEEPTVVEEDVVQSPPPPMGIWQRVRRWVVPSVEDLRDEYDQRLAELNDAVALHPDDPTNYMLRGEAYLEINKPEFALADFEKAFETASGRLEQTHWGFVMQVVQDRAQRGLLKAKQHLWRDVNVR